MAYLSVRVMFYFIFCYEIRATIRPAERDYTAGIFCCLIKSELKGYTSDKIMMFRNDSNQESVIYFCSSGGGFNQCRQPGAQTGIKIGNGWTAFFLVKN